MTKIQIQIESEGLQMSDGFQSSALLPNIQRSIYNSPT